MPGLLRMVGVLYQHLINGGKTMDFISINLPTVTNPPQTICIVKVNGIYQFYVQEGVAGIEGTTSACNLHCTGCWAAEYGNRFNLDLDTLNRIILQGKELGIYMYIYTGGEPMVRKHDLTKLCEMHPDFEFLSFTNGTLTDEVYRQIRHFRDTKPIFSIKVTRPARLSTVRGARYTSGSRMTAALSV